MKRLLSESRFFLFLLSCFIFSTLNLSAQTYYPLPTQNAYWTVYEWDESQFVYDDKVYTVDGDTLISGLDYTKVYQLNDYPTIYDTIKTLHCLMRQDNTAKKIWFIRHYLGETTEKLGYDLSAAIGDTVSLPAFDYGNVGDSLYVRITCSDVILFNGEYRTQYCFSSAVDAHPIQIIEGVTGFNNTFPDRFSFWDPFHQTYSVCALINGLSIWVSATDSTHCGFNLVHIKDPINEQINIYPNPADKHCTISCPALPGNAELTIIDIFGKTAFSSKEITSQQIDLDISGLPSGLYLLQLKTIDHTFYNKLIVNH